MVVGGMLHEIRTPYNNSRVFGSAQVNSDSSRSDFDKELH